MTTESSSRKKSIPRTTIAIVSLIVFLVGLIVYEFEGEHTHNSQVNSPSEIRVGILPDHDPERLRKRFTPVLAYLSEILEIPVKLQESESYGELLQLFHDHKVDLAYFGGYSYIKASKNNHAVPLVMRRIDTRFTSMFIVSANNEAQALEKLAGKSISFGSKLSTSGHLMPRYFLGQKNIKPESFFSEVSYSGAHDKTIFRVRDGVADIGAVNANTVRTMLAEKLISLDDIRVLWETPPYADYVWAIHPGFGDELRDKVRDAFLQLSVDNADHANLLKQLNAVGYVPADPDYFSNLEAIVEQTETLIANGIIK